jgi:alpha-tubulin suppressor-like RCC1 family protein
LKDVTAIAAGAFSGIALKKDRTVWVWGQKSESMRDLSNVQTRQHKLPVPHTFNEAEWRKRPMKEYESLYGPLPEK